MLLTQECATVTARPRFGQSHLNALVLGQRCHKYFPILCKRMCHELELREASVGEGRWGVKADKCHNFFEMRSWWQLGENSLVLQQHLSSGDGSCSDAMTPQWPSAVSAYCSFKTLSVCCRYCVHVWLRCVSKCVHMHLKQQLMQFLHLVVYECQTSFLFFLTSCRYDICIQKNKPCETLGNLPSHVTTNFHISDPADSFS